MAGVPKEKGPPVDGPNNVTEPGRRDLTELVAHMVLYLCFFARIPNDKVSGIERVIADALLGAQIRRLSVVREIARGIDQREVRKGLREIPD